MVHLQRSPLHGLERVVDSQERFRSCHCQRTTPSSKHDAQKREPVTSTSPAGSPPSVYVGPYRTDNVFGTLRLMPSKEGLHYEELREFSQVLDISRLERCSLPYSYPHQPLLCIMDRQTAGSPVILWIIEGRAPAILERTELGATLKELV